MCNKYTMEIPSRNIIFLQGVFFDKIQTIEDKMVSEQIERSNSESSTYILPTSTTPTKFKNIKSWCEATKNLQLKCWYCDLLFTGVPCFIPKQMRTGFSGKEFDVFGWFCGFACAYSFLNNHAEYRVNKTYFDKLNMLKILFISFYKKRVREFYDAPNKYSLTSYGGYLDLMDYKGQLLQINKQILQESTPAQT